MTRRIRVLVVDDSAFARKVLREILATSPDIEVVGAAADGREAVRLALQLCPDVGLFDIRMPLMDGIEATRRLAGPDVTDPLPIVVITTSASWSSIVAVGTNQSRPLTVWQPANLS